LRTSFIDHQRAPQKILPIQGFDGFDRIRIISNFSEAKSARLIGESIA